MLLSIHLMGACLVWMTTQPPADQRLTYDITLNGRHIGQLQTASLVNGQQVHYTVEAAVSMHLLGTKTMTTLFKATYTDQVMTQASFHDQLNGKTNHLSRVIREATGYLINVNDTRSRLANRKITYSTALLYYREPDSLTELFSERYGRFCPIRRVDTHRYELTMPDGKKNYYSYENGLCKEVEVHHGFWTIYFMLRNSTIRKSPSLLLTIQSTQEAHAAHD